jgi:hypothetical protein
MDCIELGLNFEWTGVESSPGVCYLFPQEVSKHLKTRFDGPAVYRWNLFLDRPGDLGVFYVGEADLLPRRLYHYLHPGPSQQTNKRLKQEFQERSERGQKIMLEVLSFSPFDFGNHSFGMDDLGNKHLRRFLEAWLTMYHLSCEHELLNK